jgi:hypothetical protein
MPCRLRLVTAGLSIQPGCVTTVCKAAEAEALVRLRAAAEAASLPAIPYVSAEASRSGRSAGTSLKSPAVRGAAPLASISRDAPR